MTKMDKIEVQVDLKALNNRIAAENRRKFKLSGVYVINVTGSPGAGKTTLLEGILPKLKDQVRVVVIEGDLATRNDAQRIERTGVAARQINTEGGCHLDARMIQTQAGQLDLAEIDLIIIENVGNLVCPASFDLGEDLRMVVLSTAEGEDKPEKYPTAFLNAHVAVITKMDLLPYLSVDVGSMARQIARINPRVRVFETGMKDGKCQADQVADYILAKVRLG
jgi:hydrogenase nickel incorporation protein HypB